MNEHFLSLTYKIKQTNIVSLLSLIFLHCFESDLESLSVINIPFLGSKKGGFKINVEIVISILSFRGRPQNVSLGPLHGLIEYFDSEGRNSHTV